MELPQTVEWALHCCWLLAQTNGQDPLPRRRIAEFFELPEAYLAKVLKQLTGGGVLTSAPGVGGGYLLARPAQEITALEVVLAVHGEAAIFHCSEIRQRGPVGLTSSQCTRPCGIAALMHQAELAWHHELANTTIAQLINDAPESSARRAAVWLGAAARPQLLALDARESANQSSSRVSII
jgi:Rrf2 family protein